MSVHRLMSSSVTSTFLQAADVLARAAQVEPDVAKAARWYVEDALLVFGGWTASELVAEGRAADVIAFLDAITACRD